MEPNLPRVIEGIDFRVIVHQDDDYRTFVATCIETGAVATGDTIEEAVSMMRAVLENDCRIAIEEGSLVSLLHSPAPFESTVRWYEAKAAQPEGAEKICLEISLGPQKRSVQSEVRYRTAQRKDVSVA